MNKPDGGVRDIVVTDVFGRVVAWTIAQQYTRKVEVATAFHQDALKTKAGARQWPTSPRFSLIWIPTPLSMMEGLRRVVDGEQILPFVRAFYGQPSTYLWDDDCGEVHTIPQGEGGEQGDPLISSSVLASTLLSPQCQPSWKRERSSSRTWTICTSVADRRGLEPSSIFWRDRCGSIPGSLSTGRRRRCGTGVGFSLQRVLHCRVLQSRFAPLPLCGEEIRNSHTSAGFKVLGIPLGHPDFVQRFLEGKIAEHGVLLERIPEVPDTQSAWLLLSFCAAARANFFFSFSSV